MAETFMLIFIFPDYRFMAQDKHLDVYDEII